MRHLDMLLAPRPSTSKTQRSSRASLSATLQSSGYSASASPAVLAPSPAPAPAVLAPSPAPVNPEEVLSPVAAATAAVPGLNLSTLATPGTTQRVAMHTQSLSLALDAPASVRVCAPVL